MKLLIILLITTLTAANCFCQTGTLTLKQGQKFSISSKVIANSSQEIMGQTMESKVTMNTTSGIEVKNVHDNNYDLTNNISRMQMNFSMTGPMAQDMSFDSDKKEDMESDKGSALKNVINHPNDVTIDNTGKITSSKKAVASDPNDMTSTIMTKVLGDPGDGSYGVGMVFLAVPKNVATGYSWIDSSSVEGSKKNTTYTIKDIRGNDLIVAINGTINTDLASEMQGVPVSTKTTGTLKGEEVVDKATGILKSRITTMETSGTVSAQGMEIPLKSKIISDIMVK